jgi:hypothetical protein
MYGRWQDENFFILKLFIFHMDRKRYTYIRSKNQNLPQVSPPKPESGKSFKETLFAASKSAVLPGRLPPALATAAAATVHPAWEGGSLVVEPQEAVVVAKVASTSRIRLEVSQERELGPPSDLLPPADEVPYYRDKWTSVGGPTSVQHLERTSSEGGPAANSHHNHHHHHPHLSKSQSFSAEPQARMFPPAAASGSTVSGSAGGGIISPMDIQRARSQLKSSRSFPDMVEDGDNSSSGVSSDQDQDSVITLLHHPKASGTL